MASTQVVADRGGGAIETPTCELVGTLVLWLEIHWFCFLSCSDGGANCCNSVTDFAFFPQARTTKTFTFATPRCDLVGRWQQGLGKSQDHILWGKIIVSQKIVGQNKSWDKKL